MKTSGLGNGVSHILGELESRGDHRNVEGMARFGIKTVDVYGVPMPEVRRIGRRLGKNHSLALSLWATGNYEARILASLVDEPAEVTARQMDEWVTQFDNWAICDGCCLNLFDKTPHAFDKAQEWSRSGEEFVKRAGFSLMAGLAIHDKRAGDDRFLPFLSAILEEADDDRNFVKKAVNWALRQVGKRSTRLNAEAVKVALELKIRESEAARWVAADALRELNSEAVKARLQRRRKT